MSLIMSLSVIIVLLLPNAHAQACGCTDSANYFDRASCEGGGCCWDYTWNEDGLCVDSVNQGAADRCEDSSNPPDWLVSSGGKR